MTGRAGSQRGAAMVEAMLGTVILLFFSLLVVQVVLVFHATLAAHAAATRSARAQALGSSPSMRDQVYNAQKGNAIKAISWQGLQCNESSTLVRCQVTVRVPSILPGGGFLFGGGFTGVNITESGQYPKIDKGG